MFRELDYKTLKGVGILDRAQIAAGSGKSVEDKHRMMLLSIRNVAHKWCGKRIDQLQPTRVEHFADGSSEMHTELYLFDRVQLEEFIGEVLDKGVQD